MPGGILAGLRVLEAYDAAALSDADPDAVAGLVATRPAWRSRRSERGVCSALQDFGVRTPLLGGLANPCRYGDPAGLRPVGGS